MDKRSLSSIFLFLTACAFLFTQDIDAQSLKKLLIILSLTSLHGVLVASDPLVRRAFWLLAGGTFATYIQFLRYLLASE